MGKYYEKKRLMINIPEGEPGQLSLLDQLRADKKKMEEKKEEKAKREKKKQEEKDKRKAAGLVTRGDRSAPIKFNISNARPKAGIQPRARNPNDTSSDEEESDQRRENSEIRRSRS